MSDQKSKCSFCRYWTGRNCMVTPNSHYCIDANNEYFQYLRARKTGQIAQKSLRPWNKNR